MNTELSVFLQVAVLAVSLFLLVKASDLVSDAAARIARITHMSEMAIGFLLLSVITSLPELAVSIFAVSSQDAGISIGTLFGSNIANLGLVLGLTALLAPSPLKIARDSFKALSLMLLVSSIVPVLALAAAGICTMVGLSLLFIFAAFCAYSIRSKVTLPNGETEANDGALRQLLLAFGGVVVVLVSAQFVVTSSVSISNFLGVEQAVVGATVIAVGTSLPELTVSLSAVRRNHVNLALGNILGSCVTNLTLILGPVLILSSLAVDATVFIQLVILLLVLNLSVWRMLVDNKIGFVEGALLLILYVVFVTSSIGVQIAILSPEYLRITLAPIAKMLAQALVYGAIAGLAIVLGINLARK